MQKKKKSECLRAEAKFDRMDVESNQNLIQQTMSYCGFESPSFDESNGAGNET